MLKQTPEQGSEILVHAGDTLTFELEVNADRKGTAWLRTNLHGARIRRQEIVSCAESETPVLDRDWFDTPMLRKNATTFTVTVPASDVGIFEAKTLFLKDGASEPQWPEGANARIKVEPASRISGNSIYSAFTRLFGKEDDTGLLIEDNSRNLKALDDAGYTVIPRSGKFRDLIGELDTIVDQMGFRILLLLPIHPTPTTYARMGRFGSPFATLDLMDVDPALAEFDRKTTPLDQFRELIDATHAHGASLFMDMPLNHTGWASALQIHHPSWFVRDRNKTFQSPGAWGVTWEDLAELNYEDRGLWQYMAEVFLFWCRHGVDGFRCDAGYMVPAEVWQYITAKVRQQFPDTIFLLEGLGGKKTTTKTLLSSSNLNWAYSEIFQNYDRSQIESYFPEADHFSAHTGILVNFAETHDNDRLASRSPAYAKMRTALCALLSRQGAFGITCGAEWYAADKIVVHERTSLNWNAKENQIDHIQRINSITSSHPAFSAHSEMRIIHSGNANAIAALRECRNPDSTVLVVVNLDIDQMSRLEWQTVESLNSEKCMDLLTGLPINLETRDHLQTIALEPGQVLCISSDEDHDAVPDEAAVQRARAMATKLVQRFVTDFAWSEGIQDKLAADLIDDPRNFFDKHIAQDGHASMTVWQWPADIKRTVPVPRGSCLLIRAPHPFRVDIMDERMVLERSTSIKGKTDFFAFITNLDEAKGPALIDIAVFDNGTTRRTKSDLFLLESVSSSGPVSLTRSAKEVRSLESTALCTNGRGAMSLVHGAWGEITSQYDALLAGNLHPAAPSDRHVMLTRCRAWLVLKGYSQEINIGCLNSFTANQPDSAEWIFSVPSGMGRRVGLRASLHMIQNKNCAELKFQRITDAKSTDTLDPDTHVNLILRFDVEDRSFHTKTKAFAGPEKSWPGQISTTESGFTFTPAGDRSLSIHAETGAFVQEHEWSYMIDHPADKERGLGPNTDLFSPGYFSIELRDGGSAIIHAGINCDTQHASQDSADPAANTKTVQQVLQTALSQYVAARDNFKTVIAGYPWFLDWGRDTLICLRGMIACGMLNESRDILCQFASFEERGTIPNMIRGDDVSNRDTSDAPLWMHVAARDLTEAMGADVLKTPCAGRSLSDVLISIAENYISGTPNGIRMDPDSGLVFSPSHFTWMDTNHPAGTPREGYPIEIQALWFRAVDFLASITGDHKWTELKDRVRESITSLYFSNERGYLSDCLHCSAGTPAVNATPDDHLRPNQLFAITLGALEDKILGSEVLNACQSLLVPGAIRSLADRRVEFELPIYRDGRLLNDPKSPYWGSYSGDEDTRRKPAYHNGTAWTWPFPSYCEALFVVKGKNSAPAALSYLSGMLHIMHTHCIGQIPELLDGNSPHTEKGCTAQAWGVSEFARVLALLDGI